MGEKYHIGQFGHARFIMKKKGKPTYGFAGYGRITDVDPINVEFTDNEGYLYIVPKSRLTFIEEEFAPVENT